MSNDWIRHPFLHLIYHGEAVSLSRRDWASWRDIQDATRDFKASLGPWSPDEAIDFLAEEYADLQPDSRAQVEAFLAGEEETCRVTFLGDAVDDPLTK